MKTVKSDGKNAGRANVGRKKNFSARNLFRIDDDRPQAMSLKRDSEAEGPTRTRL